MSIKFDHLIGLPYVDGTQDCYGILRRFYAENFNITLSDYARPKNWWLNGLSLYNDNYESEGFRLLDVNPLDWRVGDLFGIALNVPNVHHVGIYVGENKMLHHFTDRLSECVPYRLLWRKHTVCMWRHKDLMNLRPDEETVNLADHLTPFVKREIGL